MSSIDLTVASPPMQRLVSRGLYPLWRRLLGPWPLIVGGVLGLGVAAAARLLPQLPGQLIDEPATAARWMQEASSGYGVWGNLWLALGLFHALHSPLIYVALAITVPALAAQLGHEVAHLLDSVALPRAFENAEPVSAGEAMRLPAAHALRYRIVVDQPASWVVEQIELAGNDRLPALEVHHVPFASTPIGVDGADDPALEAQYEVRLTGSRDPVQAWVRPLLPLGLVIAVIALWAALVWGWQVAAPPLAPGATYRVIGQQLALSYTPSLTPTIPSRLHVNFRGVEQLLPVDQARRQQIGRATLTLVPAYPALWVATASGAAQLSLPGRGEPQPAVGLVFARGAGEESVLLPELGAGLRVVRRTTPDPGFVLELYRSDEVQPVYRAELPANGRVVIPLARTNLELIVATLPGLLVNVRYLPSLWLAWVGLTLALIGAAATLRAAGWIAVQVAPWPVGRTVVVVQTSDPRWLEFINGRLELSAAAGSSTPQPKTH